MTSPTIARVLQRHTLLATDAPVTLTSEADAPRFVALDDPPPVRTVLQLIAAQDGAAEVELVEVVRVREVAADGSRGAFVAAVRDPAQALAAIDRVGTEHLAAGPVVARPTADASAGSSPSDAGNAAGAAASADGTAQLATPAPVVVHDPSEPIDVRDPDAMAVAAPLLAADEPGDEATASGESAGAAVTTTDDGDGGADEAGGDEPSSDEPSSDEPSSDEAGAKGKKRKGRRRG